MLGTMNSPALPPSVPTDAALLGAFSLLQALGNAQNSAAMLNTMAEHKKAMTRLLLRTMPLLQRLRRLRRARARLPPRSKIWRAGRRR